MKTLFTTILGLFFTCTLLFGQAQKVEQQEIFIIGASHTVPKIVKHSYGPVLKMAKKYDPQAIYVENPRPEDNESWEYLKDGWSNYYKKFYFLSDSLQKSTYKFNQERFTRLMNKKFEELSQTDLNTLINDFGYKRDISNHGFYISIKRHGLEGPNEPTRNEFGDVTYKLAIAQGIRKIRPMDDQRTNGQYHTAWQQCSQEGIDNGNNEINQKLYKKLYNASILPGILGRLGFHVNKRKSLQNLHNMSSFGYAKIKTPGCIDGERYWTERNERMANNIASQVLASDNTRNIVIVGAAHVIGLEKILKENYPMLKITLVDTKSSPSSKSSKKSIAFSE